MRTVTIRAAGAWVLAAVQRFGSTVLCGLALGFAIVAFWQQAVTGFGTDPGVQLGMGLGVLAGAVWGLSAVRNARRWTHAADWLSLGGALAVWPMWIALQMDSLDWLPASVWQRSWCVAGLGSLLGLLTMTVPTALVVRLCRDEQRCPAVLGYSAVAGMLLQTFVFGANVGVWIPALIAIVACAVITCMTVRDAASTSSQTVAVKLAWSVTGLQMTAAIALGVVMGSTQGWFAALWPVTAVTSQLSLAALVLGGLIAFRIRSLRSSATIACVAVMAVVLLIISGGSVDFVLWQNATLTTSWQWESVRALSLFAVWGMLGGCAALLNRGIALRPAMSVATIGTGIGAGMIIASSFLVPTWGPRAGFALAAVIALVCHFGVLLFANDPTPRRSWSWAGGLTAALVLSVGLCGTSWNTARSTRLLFSTTSILAYRSGWEPRLLERFDDARMISTFPGRQGNFTVWQMKGGEWHLRENGVPVGAISLAPAWYPQFAPEAAAALWPLTLVEQPERVLMLGAGSGAGLRMCSAFPLPEVVCHEADRQLIDWIQGPLAAATGYNPFADRCQWVPQPAEWLSLPNDAIYDVIVSSPRLPAQQAGLACYTVEYYQRAARHLSERGVFCQRFSGVDLGPRPLLSAARSLQAAFPETACLEVGAGEYLLLAAKTPEVLVRKDLATRLENRIALIAGALGWDWSLPLNLPAYDGPALREAAEELRVGPHSVLHTGLGFTAPFEMMRWGPKLQETAAILSKPRTSAPRFPLPSAEDAPRPIETAARSRKGRYLEWLGAAGDNPVILRRLAELAGEQKLIRDYPDSHWWEYRKELREQLQDHPRTKVLPVKHKVESPSDWHSEDRRRKIYFETLGELAQDEHATPEAYQAFAAVLEPHDPLLTLFGHQELAELLARRDQSPAEERWHRLHAIYYAPSQEASVRNVVAAIDRGIAQPDTALPPVQRFDELNGLLQTLRARWEARNQRPNKAAQVTLQEIERSQLAVEHALVAMEPLAADAGYTPADWSSRKEVIERLLLRPFRAYREELSVRVRESEARAKAKQEAASAL